MKHPDKILSMTEFVLWLQDNLHLFWNATKECYDTDRAWHLTINYAELLQTHLSLEMLVAVKDETVLDKELAESEYRSGHINFYEEYEQARKKILFEGCEIYKQEMGRPTCFKIDGETIARLGIYKSATVEWLNGETIESLIYFMDLTGTETFWNQIFKP